MKFEFFELVWKWRRNFSSSPEFLGYLNSSPTFSSWNTAYTTLNCGISWSLATCSTNRAASSFSWLSSFWIETFANSCGCAWKMFSYDSYSARPKTTTRRLIKTDDEGTRSASNGPTETSCPSIRNKRLARRLTLRVLTRLAFQYNTKK